MTAAPLLGLPVRMWVRSLLAVAGLMFAGCGDGLKDVRQYERGEAEASLPAPPDTRQTLWLNAAAAREHGEAMLQHLETLDQIVGALAAGNFSLAQMHANAHAAFFARRMLMVKQPLESYPPNFQELAVAHQSATETLAASLPSKDYARILSALDGVLKACTACHRAFTVQHGAQ